MSRLSSDQMSSIQLSTQSLADKPAAGVYTYIAQWPVYSLAWSFRQDGRFRLAVGSALEDYNNKVELVQFCPSTSVFTSDHRLVLEHPYSPTNIMFLPSEDMSHPEMVATSGDCLRLWEVGDDKIELRAMLGNKAAAPGELSSAITSFDWAEFDLSRVATCSVDTTCTIWDVEKATVDVQLVAHDKEVYDISWGGHNIFASVAGDGSVRVFDLRDKERSTIIYENVVGPETKPLLRLEWNKADPRYMATIGMDSSKVVILDIRFPTMPIVELDKHQGSANAISWAPHTGRHLCSVGDDSRALIWNVLAVGLRLESTSTSDIEPEMWYGSTLGMNNARWSPVDPEWIGITMSNKLQILRV